MVADLAKEVADLYEIIDALIISLDMDHKANLKLQIHHRAQRDSFDKCIKLLCVE